MAHAMVSLLFVSLFVAPFQLVSAGTILYDGRAPLSLKSADLDASNDPFLTGVKGTEAASHYTAFLGHSVPATPLWNKLSRVPLEQAVSVTIDNSSVFYPGGNNPQFGFRRTELIAQKNKDHSGLNQVLEVGTTVFHFSIKKDLTRPLNYDHEYQIVFIEPNDGTHVFGVQLGSPFTNPTGRLPAKDAHSFKVLDHSLNVLFTTPFLPETWHNFAVQVDWDNRTLAVFFSKDGAPLKPVTKVVPNPTVQPGAAGQGDFHVGVLKLPLVDPADTPANQGDVVHHGTQEGSTEGLFYSGIFVEDVKGGVTVAPRNFVKPLV
ncbi:hypothetical protein BDN72DRAFT_887930 [Pluteus cervinus]|uniref:Uncharacterized protein n=1 Tax=Pluteus cervinus TaxID=181527 RepID=A0ACD3AXV6_9AGAR|nr:hypothetical protein BDN72DRAFT_887930 [Pluteus cervinus]